MFTGILHTHNLLVVLFLLQYLVKVVLLLANQPEMLGKFKRKTRIAEMVISGLMVLSGIGLAFLSGAIRQDYWFVLKLVAVIGGIGLGVVAFKRNNKVLALVSVLVFAYSMAVSYAKHPLLMAPARTEIISTAPSTPEALMAAGLKVYQEQCIHCHGENGNLKRGGAKDLTLSQLDMAGVKNLILNGKGNMAAYKSVLSPAEVEAVATYVMAYRK